MSNIVVIAPHPDDETLGCGGTLLKHKKNGDKIFWIIVTGIGEGYSTLKEDILSREKEIKEINEVSKLFNFDKVYKLNFPTTELDTIPIKDIIKEIAHCINDCQGEVIYIPNYSDIHTDHKIVASSSISCTKWFRFPTVKKVLVYETLSETDFAINNSLINFNPNVFIDITDFIDKKIEILNKYKDEVKEMPFPRSSEAIRALSICRGVASGFNNAEAFMLLRERVD